MFKNFKLAAVIGAGLLLAGGGAQATSVPAGTLKLNDFNVAVDNTNFTVTLSVPLIYGGGGGAFSSANGIATGDNNPFLFSSTTGGVISYSGANMISSFLAFSDGAGENYTFSLDQSITTTQYSYQPGVTGTVNLYLLGDLTGTGSTIYNTPTPTALTLQLNFTGSSGYSFAGTLSNPPPGLPGQPVPEPASMTMLGGGLAALSFLRRRRARK